MRYMMLIYSQENGGQETEAARADAMQATANAHNAVMQETVRRKIFRAADALAASSTATTVRVKDGKVLVTDGPFAETKEQLAGYYVLDCRDLDEALEWAAKIPTGCQGGEGCVEVRPFREMRMPALLNE